MSRWQPRWKTWLPLALLLMWGGQWVQQGPFHVTHPGFFAERLGYLLLLTMLVQRITTSLHQRIPMSWLQLMGRESLLIYAGHLLLLYALPLIDGHTLEQRWGGRLTLWQTAAALVMMLLLCTLLAWVNEQRKQSKRSSLASTTDEAMSGS